MKRFCYLITILLLFVFVSPLQVQAQSLLFELDSVEVDYFINSDGTASVVYIFRFINSPFGAVIDYVDVGLPNPNFVDSTISATINGIPVTQHLQI
jgi:hypothetical protein